MLELYSVHRHLKIIQIVLAARRKKDNKKASSNILVQTSKSYI